MMIDVKGIDPSGFSDFPDKITGKSCAGNLVKPRVPMKIPHKSFLGEIIFILIY